MSLCTSAMHWRWIWIKQQCDRRTDGQHHDRTYGACTQRRRTFTSHCSERRHSLQFDHSDPNKRSALVRFFSRPPKIHLGPDLRNILRFMRQSYDRRPI